MLVVGLDDLSYRGLPPSGFDGEPVSVNFFGQLKPHARWIRNASSRFRKFGGRICQPRCFLPQGTRVQRALSRSPVQVCMDCAPNRSQILKGLVPASRIPLPTDTPRFHAGLDFVNFGDRLEVDRNFAFRIWKALSLELRLNVETNQLNKQMCFYLTVSFSISCFDFCPIRQRASAGHN